VTTTPGGYYFILACQGSFKCTHLHIHSSCPSTSRLLFWKYYMEIIWANSV